MSSEFQLSMLKVELMLVCSKAVWWQMATKRMFLAFYVRGVNYGERKILPQSKGYLYVVLPSEVANQLCLNHM